MAFGFTITTESIPDFTARHFVADAKITVVTGTYPAGGIGPLKLASLMGLGIQSAVPSKSWQDSVASPPTGLFYVYNPTTDKIQAFVPGASGAAMAEFSGTIPADIIQVQQWFNRGQ